MYTSKYFSLTDSLVPSSFLPCENLQYNMLFVIRLRFKKMILLSVPKL